MGAKVADAITMALEAYGTEPDPTCWVVWGDDPGVRYAVLVPSPGGLVTLNVRVSIPGEGPRVSSKLTRWARAQLGELAIDVQSGHLLTGFQIDATILRGADAQAKGIATFALDLFAAMDGRPLPSEVAAATGKSTRSAAAGRTGAKGIGGPKPARTTHVATKPAKASPGSKAGTGR
jgi:hypothetical protein